MKPKRRNDKYNDKIYYTVKYSQILHREGGPAVTISNYKKEWYRYGKRHRLDGPAIEYRDGYRMWFKNGKIHRDGGPAVYFEGKGRNSQIQEWFKDGEKHRTEGPAMIYFDGRLEWWLNGIFYTKEEWFEALTPEQQQAMLFSEYFIN